MAWKKLQIIPEGTAPYYYENIDPKLMMKLVNDWSSRGINVTILLFQSYDSPLFLENYLPSLLSVIE